jgi:hypothetical protein
MDTLLTLQNGQFQTLGDVLRNGKNKTGSSFNNRSFTLLGDPALRLAYPQHKEFGKVDYKQTCEQHTFCLST